VTYSQVKNCPFAEANGRYMLRGYMNGTYCSAADDDDMMEVVI